MERFEYGIIGALIGGGVAFLWTLLQMATKGNKGDISQSKLTGTSLHDAVKSGDLDRVRNELKDMSKLNEANSCGFTPLNVAAWQGDSKVIKILLDAGADVKAKDVTGATVLHQAFIGYDTRKNSPDNEKVSLDELIKTITLLVNKGVDVNSISPMGTFALQGAAFVGSVDLIKTLVENGAELNACKKDGFTPLAIAVSQNNSEVVDLLLEYNAKLIVNNEPNTENILEFAKTTGVNEQIFKSLERKVKNEY